MIVSIDIGTSYSSICVLNPEGKPQAVDISTGASMYGSKYSLPSAVFAEENGNLLVGQAAMNSRKHKPQNFRAEFKRNLGESIPILLGDSSYLPEDLYTALFRHMKACAEKTVGESIGKAYLTYPASFGRLKKEKILSAAKAAGLFETELVDEPTAAAMCYCAAGYLKDGQNLMVYDFGGGTFDVSLIRYENGKFSLLTEPSGLERCGGVDIDRAIYQDMLGRIDKDLLEPLTANPLHRLRLESQLAELAVKAKHHLSTAQDFEEDISLGFDLIPYRLTLEKLNGMIAGMVGQTVACCQSLLQNAGLKNAELSIVLMVGGTSRVPLVREMVSQFAGKTPVLHSVDLELAVAQGAMEQVRLREEVENARREAQDALYRKALEQARKEEEARQRAAEQVRREEEARRRQEEELARRKEQDELYQKALEQARKEGEARRRDEERQRAEAAERAREEEQRRHREAEERVRQEAEAHRKEEEERKAGFHQAQMQNTNFKAEGNPLLALECSCQGVGKLLPLEGKIDLYDEKLVFENKEKTFEILYNKIKKCKMFRGGKMSKAEAAASMIPGINLIALTKMVADGRAMGLLSVHISLYSGKGYNFLFDKKSEAQNVCDFISNRIEKE